MKKGEAWVAAQVILFTVYLGLPWRAPHASVLAAVGLALVAAGLALLSAGLFRLRRQLTALPMPTDGAKLATDGPFALVRHPIYAGVLLAAAGWAVAAADAPRLLMAAVLFVFFDAKSRFEETLLERRFPEYAAYRRRVKRLIAWLY